jgi:hypothetical protein
MIIEKNALYQNLQDAFSTHHPKFPWPKRHDLIDQTEEFKNAFDQFYNSVNEAVRSEIIEHRNIERDYYTGVIEKKDIEIVRAQKSAMFPWFLLGLMIGAFLLGLFAATL